MLPRILNKLRNGFIVYHLTISFKDISFCTKILDLLWKENLIRGYTRSNDGLITVLLRYYEGSPVCTRIIVLSRPRDRLYLSSLDIFRFSKEFGVLVVSTRKGIMISDEAIQKGEGGEILAYVS